jgi:trehalose/maltose hydrolase-like predicted phosphorylase
MKVPYTWKIFYSSFEPSQEGLREALCTLGNGYLGTRGSIPECSASDIHYPGTYIAGVYNRLRSHLAGRTVFNEDMVNCPNWTFLTFKVKGGEWFYPSAEKILSFYQELNMRGGVLKRKILFQDEKGRKTLVQSYRIVDMSNPHLAMIKYVITPQNYSGRVTVRTMLDGSIYNTGVKRYRQLNCKHWKPHRLGKLSNSLIYLSMITSQSKIKVSQAAKVGVFSTDRKIRPEIMEVFKKNKKTIGEEFSFSVHKGKPCVIEKIVSIYTSHDSVRSPLAAAIKSAKKRHRFDTIFQNHKRAWEQLWERSDIKIEGNTFSQKILRLHIFHLLQTASPHTPHYDVGLPARGLHGEAYRGHIFWDEIFAMPFYNFHFPHISKGLLLYRYRRLPQARQYARREGYKGARFPWQSASSGKEETQAIHLNPLSGKWGVDYSRAQVHISFAVAYNVWNYWDKVLDYDFLIRYGAEMLLSIAQFGASLAKYSYKDKRYHTSGIMGPDEFHEKYPHTSKAGLKDNAYTNFMIVWTILKAKEVLSLLPKRERIRITKKIGLEDREVKRWDRIVKRMNIIFNKRGIISQFDGYFKLKEINFDKYRAKYKDIHRMDRILKAEGKSPDDYKVSKQADVLMIFYLFSLEEISEIFKRLGYPFSKTILRRNYDYYMRRTTHGSTLSKVVHCFVASLINKSNKCWQLFQEILKSDFYDTQGGTTPEGIHIGVMGGSIDIVMRVFAGITMSKGEISVKPNLPDSWSKLQFKFHYRGNWFIISITKRQLMILLYKQRRKGFPITISVGGKRYFPILAKPLKLSAESFSRK